MSRLAAVTIWVFEHKRMPEARLQVPIVDLAGAAKIAEILAQEQVPYKAD
jgi:hypothetical protein